MKPLLAAWFLASVAVAQTFEVASLKQSAARPDASGMSISGLEIVSPGRLRGSNANLRECLEWAYDLRTDQITGPEWLNDNKPSFDIEAKAPPSTTPAEMRLMVRKLLDERFQLVLRRETRVLPVFELVVAKGGPKLPPPKQGAVPGLVRSGRAEIHAGEITTRRLARSLQDELRRHVFDKTGLNRPFSVDLEFAPEGDSSGDRPSLTTALERVLGLKLQPARAPIEFLVVEHARRLPSEN